MHAGHEPSISDGSNIGTIELINPRAACLRGHKRSSGYPCRAFDVPFGKRLQRINDEPAHQRAPMPTLSALGAACTAEPEASAAMCRGPPAAPRGKPVGYDAAEVAAPGRAELEGSHIHTIAARRKGHVPVQVPLQTARDVPGGETIMERPERDLFLRYDERWSWRFEFHDHRIRRHRDRSVMMAVVTMVSCFEV
jgi:hypothetical protein